MPTTTITQSRQAHKDGEILTVVTLNTGAKVLADFADRDQVVELQLYRKVRLVGLPEHIQREFAVLHTVKAIHVSVPHVGNASGFSFDGSVRRSVCLQSLSDGQLIDVLPDVVEAVAVVRLPVPSPELASRVAVPVYS